MTTLYEVMIKSNTKKLTDKQKQPKKQTITMSSVLQHLHKKLDTAVLEGRGRRCLLASHTTESVVLPKIRWKVDT